MEESADEARADRFSERYGELSATNADRAASDALRPEANTVAQAIVEAIGDGPLPGLGGPELREGLTLASLLGRRAAMLDVTPAAGLALAPALVHALAQTHDVTPMLDALRATVMDGYVRGREEREREISCQRAGDAMPYVELTRGCFAFLPRGLQEPEQIERRVDDLGRSLLDRDARACVVDASGLLEPDRERAAQLFAVHATCLMLGVRDVFVQISEPWLRVAGEGGIDLEMIRFAPTFRGALEDALEACELEVRPPGALDKVVRRLLGR